MSKKKKNNNKKENHPRIRIGERHCFPCITDDSGRHFISGIFGNIDIIEKGIGFDVKYSGEGNRHILAKLATIYQEIQVGDYIIEYDRFEENKLYMCAYEICDFCNNAVVTYAVDDHFFYRVEETSND